MKAYQHMWQLIRYRPWLYAANCLIWWTIHLAPIVPGLIAQHYFNLLAKNSEFNQQFWILSIWLVMTAMGRVVLVLSGGWTDTVHRFCISALLRRNLLERILERPGARAVPGSPGEAISIFRDDAERAEDAISWTIDNTGLALFAMVSMIILLRINVPITLFVFVPLVFIVAIVQAQEKRLENYRRASREATGRVTSAIGEIFSSIQAIQGAAAEEQVITHFQTLNEKRRTTMLKDSVLEQILSSTFENTVGLGTGLILILGAQTLQSQQISIGDLALFIYYLAFVSDFTSSLGMFLAHYAQTKVAFQRMETLLQGAPAPAGCDRGRRQRRCRWCKWSRPAGAGAPCKSKRRRELPSQRTGRGSSNLQADRQGHPQPLHDRLHTASQQ